MPLRILTFLGLLSAYLLLAQHTGMSLWGPRYNNAALRFHALFLSGAWLALFHEGESFGHCPPISTRPLWALLGTILMAASALWTHAIGTAR